MIEYNAILNYLNSKMDLVPRGWLAIGAAFAIGGDAGKKQIATRVWKSMTLNASRFCIFNASSCSK